MPEGDTVFLTCQRLHEALAGNALTRGELRHPRWAGHNLAGLVVREVRPRGKHLLIRLSDDRTLHNHLRMDGTWHLYSTRQRWRRPAHQARVVLGTVTRNAIGFNLHDLALVATAEEEQLVGHLGPDLLDPEWSDAHHDEAVRRLTVDPHRQLGVALLDQTALAGVGNLYRTEVCFLLGCSPRTPIGAVDAGQAVRCCRRLLLRNAWHPEQSTTGQLRRGAQHWVYGRRHCLRCGTPVVREDGSTDDSGRVSYHCPRCQPPPDEPGTG